MGPSPNDLHTPRPVPSAAPPKGREETLRPEDLKELKGQATQMPLDDEDDAPVDLGKSDTHVPRQEVNRRIPVLITLDGRRVSERFILDRDVSVLGRDIKADVLVVDGEISRRHLEIQWRNRDAPASAPECYARDLGSTNGSYLNNEKLEGVRRLRDGDQIRLGKTILGFFEKDERVLELDQLLMTMALHDALTGLFKREFLFGELHREFERSRRHKRPLAILMLDIDHFKSVNDELGHLAGDEALRQMAQTIRLSLRDGDICGRFGGEEFIVILPETDVEGAALAGERIRRNIEEHSFDLGRGVTRRLTASLGVALLCPEMHGKLELVEAADSALYRAKREGRNRVCIAPPCDSTLPA